MIRIEKLYKALGGEPVLRGVDLAVDRGEIVALVGPSGTGKSVLPKHIVGLMQPDAGDVSGGMRKRVAVARSIINRPEIMLYDEPTSGLDPRNVARMDDLISRMRDRLRATSVVITHDLGSVQRIADRVALLVAGKVRFSGTVAEFFASREPEVAAFTGRDTEQFSEAWGGVLTGARTALVTEAA